MFISSHKLFSTYHLSYALFSYFTAVLTTSSNMDNDDVKMKLVHKKSFNEFCSLCKKSFYSLKQHMKVHDLSRMVEQMYMPEELVPELKENGKVQLNTAVIDVNRVCSICLKIYSNSTQRKNHERLHEDPKKHIAHI